MYAVGLLELAGPWLPAAALLAFGDGDTCCLQDRPLPVLCQWSGDSTAQVFRRVLHLLLMCNKMTWNIMTPPTHHSYHLRKLVRPPDDDDEGMRHPQQGWNVIAVVLPLAQQQQQEDDRRLSSKTTATDTIPAWMQQRECYQLMPLPCLERRSKPGPLPPVSEHNRPSTSTYSASRLVRMNYITSINRLFAVAQHQARGGDPIMDYHGLLPSAQFVEHALVAVLVAIIIYLVRSRRSSYIQLIEGIKAKAGSKQVLAWPTVYEAPAATMDMASIGEGEVSIGRHAATMPVEACCSPLTLRHRHRRTCMEPPRDWAACNACAPVSARMNLAPWRRLWLTGTRGEPSTGSSSVQTCM